MTKIFKHLYFKFCYNEEILKEDFLSTETIVGPGLKGILIKNQKLPVSERPATAEGKDTLTL